MAKSSSEATPEGVEVSRDLLEDAALAIYMDLSKGAMRGYHPEVVARQSFAQAAAFVKVAQSIRDGEPVPTDRSAEEAQVEMVDVHQWDPVSGKPLFDEHGQKVIVKMPADRFAFAPNLPPDHPINQRYRPLTASRN